MKHAYLRYVFSALIMVSTYTSATAKPNLLDELENYQVNSPRMISSGLPTNDQFALLKANGVTSVIDLIPGDRSAEADFLRQLDLNYVNIPVDWHNPTLANFQQYVAAMQASFNEPTGITLTHCKLNWRGAVFTYLYRTTQLGVDEQEAKQDLLAIWQPDETWQAFIDKVKSHYTP